MYDSRSEAREFVALTREEAIAKATAFFRTEVESLEIRHLPQGEVYGLAARALVVARPVRTGREMESRAPSERSRPDRRPAREERPERPRREAPPREPREEMRSAPPAPAPAAAEEREIPTLPSREPQSEGPTALSPVAAFVSGIIERMDIGECRVQENLDGDVRVISVSGPAVAQLTEGQSRALEAIKLLGNQASLRQPEEGIRKVVIEAEEDQGVREEFLTQLAWRAARRAQSARRSIALEPMESKDRRVVHLALREERDIATMSIGSGRYRQVVVVPSSAPEWEEARAYEEAAAQREE